MLYIHAESPNACNPASYQGGDSSDAVLLEFMMRNNNSNNRNNESHFEDHARASDGGYRRAS
jgi:hypothetical protein